MPINNHCHDTPGYTCQSEICMNEFVNCDVNQFVGVLGKSFTYRKKFAPSQIFRGDFVRFSQNETFFLYVPCEPRERKQLKSFFSPSHAIERWFGVGFVKM